MSLTHRRLVLAKPGTRLQISPDEGGRISSLAIDGLELLVTADHDPVRWGCYAMVPFAGRIRNGRFAFAGRTYQLARTMPPHAIHGTVRDRRWEVLDEQTLGIDLGPDWPFAGRVEQRFDLETSHLRVTLSLIASEAMPAYLGWHPWFSRRLPRPGPGRASDPLRLTFDAATMFERDPDGISSRRRVVPTSGPWDDCFTDVTRAPKLTWPGALELELASSCAFWVVYDEMPHAICVEPQVAPPNDLNHEPLVVEPGCPLVATMDWRWRSLPATGGGDSAQPRRGR